MFAGPRTRTALGLFYAPPVIIAPMKESLPVKIVVVLAAFLVVIFLVFIPLVMWRIYAP